MARTHLRDVTPARAHQAAARNHTTVQASDAARKSHFRRHFVEMVLSMLVGMALLGVPFRAILGALGYTWDEAVWRFPMVICVVMTFNMAVGMLAWMRFRGHRWRVCAEMTVAMYAATAITLGLLWRDIISTDMLIGWLHILMVPAMLFAMLCRRDEYAHSRHFATGSESASHSGALDAVPSAVGSRRALTDDVTARRGPRLALREHVVEHQPASDAVANAGYGSSHLVGADGGPVPVGA